MQLDVRLKFDYVVPYNMAYRNIALSGRIAAGSSSLAQALSQELGWRLRDGSQIFRDTAQKLGYDLEKAPQTYEEEIDRQVDEETRSILRSRASIIVVSKLAGFLSRDFSHTLRALLTCPFKIRAQRKAAFRGYTMAEAKKLLKKREVKDQSKWQRLYGPHDFFDPKYFNLVLDSSKLSVKEEVEEILQFC